KPDPALNLTNAAADETELTGILGGSVTFPLRISAAQKFKNGAWSVNTKSLVTVTAGKPPRVLVFDPSYEGRLRFSDESYSLQITDLRMEDTGSYTVEFSTDKEQFAYREFTLHVSSKCWGRGIPEGAWNPPCSGNSQDGRENVTYSWSNAPSSVLSTDSIVHIPQRHQAAREDVTCMARAPDGNSSRRTVSPKDFCAGNALRRETLERAGIGSPPRHSPHDYFNDTTLVSNTFALKGAARSFTHSRVQLSIATPSGPLLTRPGDCGLLKNIVNEPGPRNGLVLGPTPRLTWRLPGL
uniref:Immunoglobulin domain-containing protein n=1 Tax=Terrapene triunguis TaxID=2587831 RepID=A0A674JAG8_9SAUR